MNHQAQQIIKPSESKAEQIKSNTHKDTLCKTKETKDKDKNSRVARGKRP